MELSVHGATVHCELSGAGTATVVVLHGWGASIEVMRPIVDHLAASFRVLAVDFPGFGQSPPPPEAWGVPQYADMTAALLGQLDIRRPILLGHSFGGRVILYLVGQLGYEADRLILVGSAGIKPPASGKVSARTRLFKLGKAAVSPLPARLREPLLERLRGRFGSADYRAAQGVMREVLVKTVNLDLAPLLPGITAETLLIWGDQDSATPLWQAQQMARLLPNAGLAVIPGAGHYSFFDNPPLFYAILDSYTRSLGVH
ncbi:MAG: alpha/beta hydrolase [Clostridiales bacterium]|nr:alpha/beta hydrolase [Clostridiales bacterium]